MVRKMNKKEWLRELQTETGYSEEKCLQVNEIIESQIWFGKRGRETVITKFIEEFHLEQTEAEKLYEISQKIIATGFKNSIQHPFRSKEDE